MKGRALWQISVSINPEAEDAVVELVQRLFDLTPWVYRREEDGATFVTIYSPQRTCPDRRVFDALAVGLKQIQKCGVRVHPGTITIKKIKQQDWAEAWKRHFKPIEIGRSLLIKPSWSKRRQRKGQAVVVLDPGLSFGTGQHPTTAFCLKQLVEARRADIVQSFLDIGTGSGILAISAAKLGYQPVHAIDSDREAVRVARDNARKNRARIDVVEADLTGLTVRSKFKYDVICANLTFDVLISERNRIVNRLRPGGTLILAGILQTEFARVRKRYRAVGLRLLSAETSREWSSGLFASDRRLSAFHPSSQKNAKRFLNALGTSRSNYLK